MDNVKIGEILVPVSSEETRRREDRVREKFWRTTKRAARAIPFMDEVVAAYYCAFDAETPTRARGILIGALAYFVLPTDFIPDFLLAFGFTDDLAVLTAAITAIRPHIKDHHRAAARQALED
ncbi:MAG: YkvA family protein [Rhizobiaceae bacterium]